MNLEQMKKIVDGAPPKSEEWRTHGFYYRCDGKYYWCVVNKEWIESISWNTFHSYKIDDLRTELAKREPMELRAVDIPHGTIVLEK